jgi:hypothetical protein
MLALPFMKEPVKSSKEFLGVWTDTKAYVRSVSGHGGSYQTNKAQRLSEEFSWPEDPLPPSQSGEGYLFVAV